MFTYPLKSNMCRIYIFIMLFIPALSVAQNSNHISYQLTVTDAQHHLAEVTTTFPNINSQDLIVKLPVWRTGRYEILNLSKNINQFSAHDANGNKLTWNKTDKNSWKIFLDQPGDVIIKYQVYANALTHRVAHIDETHAFLDATGVFMFAPTFREQALTVSLNVPKPWQSRSGLEKTDTHTFVAQNYDQLVDSPIESGIHEFLSFEVEDKTYELLIWGEGNHDIQDLKHQITLLHYEAKKIWGTFPFDRYVYMYHAGNGIRGATEHVNSTIIQQDRFNFKPKKLYLKVLATTAHEFVHTWNVKAYRPSGIAPYDYSQENYSDLFWMAEGITSYYDDLLLMRAGIYEPKEYFDKVAEDMYKHLNKPGRKVESLAQTSFDTWLKDDPQHTHNSSVSIYLEGSMMAWRLDQEIRSLTNNKHGLDQLQKLLYQKHNNIDHGYTKSDVLQLLKNITGQDMNPFWNTYIEGTQSIDFDHLLAFYGLKKTLKNPIDKTTGSSQEAWIGAVLNLDHELVQIKAVDSDSPAWLAGLNAGDQLLAIDGIQVNNKNITERIKQLSLVDKHSIHYFNAGRLRKTEISATAHPNLEFKIEVVDEPSKQQKNRFKAWTGLDLVQN